MTGFENSRYEDFDVQLRPVVDGDWTQIRRWLGQPDIERWWGPKASSEAAVLLALGSSHALCRMVEANGTAVGYAQAVDAALWGEALPEGLEPGTWDIDVFIASVQHRDRGIGVCALQLIRDEVFSTTLAPAVCIFAAVGNERAVRAYEKAGFAWRSVEHGGRGPEWFMTAKRPTA